MNKYINLPMPNKSMILPFDCSEQFSMLFWALHMPISGALITVNKQEPPQVAATFDIVYFKR